MKNDFLNSIDDVSSIFFTSDHHFGHQKIIEYCNRPFSSVEEMGTKLVDNWNLVVKPVDIVYYLGDFCLGNVDFGKDIVSQLNFKKLILAGRGNHDLSDAKMSLMGFDEVWPRLFFTYKDYNFILKHKPFSQEELLATSSILQICGHRHSKKEQHIFYNKHILTYDVGVDSHDYTPINIETIINELKNANLDYGDEMRLNYDHD